MLNHKHICGLESVYETENSTYIVMENLAVSLFGWIQKYGFPVFEVARLMVYQLLKGI
jgi:serine/threonine protein kinase